MFGPAEFTCPSPPRRTTSPNTVWGTDLSLSTPDNQKRRRSPCCDASCTSSSSSSRSSVSTARCSPSSPYQQQQHDNEEDQHDSSHEPQSAESRTPATPAPTASSPRRRGRRPSTKSGRWSLDEKILFLYALRKFGKGRWKKMSRYIPGRSLIQIKSHAQKVMRHMAAGENIYRRLDENQARLEVLLAKLEAAPSAVPEPPAAVQPYPPVVVTSSLSYAPPPAWATSWPPRSLGVPRSSAWAAPGLVGWPPVPSSGLAHFWAASALCQLGNSPPPLATSTPDHRASSSPLTSSASQRTLTTSSTSGLEPESRLRGVTPLTPMRHVWTATAVT